MAEIKYLRYALVAVAMVGVFALTGFTNAGDASPTTYAQPAVGAAAPHGTTSAAPYHYQPQRPREDLPCNPPGTWEVSASPTTKNLHCVDFVDINNGWACGPGVMLRYRNANWTEEPGHTTRDYRDLDMVTATDGWAVGREGTTDIWTIWRWDGSSWNVFQTVTGAIYCINMVDANHGWIGGNGYFLRFNGTNWEIGGSAPNTVYGIQMFSDVSGWAVGAPGIIMRRSGSIWQTVPAGSDWMLADVSMIDSTNGWAAGYKRFVEDAIIIKCSNSIWTEYKTFGGTTSIGDLDIYQRNFGWATGARRTSPPLGAFLAFFDGKDWAAVPDPTDKGLGGIKIINLDTAWIVGEAGIILKYKPNVSINETSFGKIKAIYR
jgi:hypothetical protein